MKISRFFHLGVLSAICILSALTLQAQIEFGVKFGINVSELAAERFSPVSIGGNQQFIRNFPRKGINTGIIMSVPITKHWSLQPELVFSEQGATGKPQSEYLVSATQAYQYNWLNLPILLKYTWPTGLFAETGPQAGLLLNAEIAQTVVGAQYTSWYNVNNQYKKIDLGWTFGVGYISPINLGFDLRYTYGLTNIANIQTGETAPVQKGDIKNSVVSFGVFYLFGKPRVSMEP